METGIQKYLGVTNIAPESVDLPEIDKISSKLGLSLAAATAFLLSGCGGGNGGGATKEEVVPTKNLSVKLSPDTIGDGGSVVEYTGADDKVIGSADLEEGESSVVFTGIEEGTLGGLSKVIVLDKDRNVIRAADIPSSVDYNYYDESDESPVLQSVVEVNVDEVSDIKSYLQDIIPKDNKTESEIEHEVDAIVKSMFSGVDNFNKDITLDELHGIYAAQIDLMCSVAMQLFPGSFTISEIKTIYAKHLYRKFNELSSDKIGDAAFSSDFFEMIAEQKNVYYPDGLDDNVTFISDGISELNKISYNFESENSLDSYMSIRYFADKLGSDYSDSEDGFEMSITYAKKLFAVMPVVVLHNNLRNLPTNELRVFLLDHYFTKEGQDKINEKYEFIKNAVRLLHDVMKYIPDNDVDKM